MTATETITDPTYSSGDVVRLTGATYRQLDHWARTGHLPDNATGSGSARTFTAADLDTVRLVVHLTRFGLALDRAFEIARTVIADDEYRATLADVFELVVHVRDTSSPVEKPEPPDQEGTP